MSGFPFNFQIAYKLLQNKIKIIFLKFKESLKELTDSLHNSTIPDDVRCIKPNDQKMASK